MPLSTATSPGTTPTRSRSSSASAAVPSRRSGRSSACPSARTPSTCSIRKRASELPRPPSIPTPGSPTSEGIHVTSTVPYRLSRVGVLMSPDVRDPFEVEGVLNPATAWTTDGDLLLYPRLVAAGNVSRVGRARVILDDGVPRGVERQGVALEPDRPWEHGVRHGGVEDPRITFIPSLGAHAMTYVAYGPFGPHPAVAISRDLERWTRLGPFQFEYDDALEIDLNLYPNKDVVFFPDVVPDPDGRPSYALLHRPMWEFSFAQR